MLLKKIISGGQTGADRAGLEIARQLGIPTGGYATRGYLTENGPDMSLKDFGLIEAQSDKYPPRTRLNAEHSDGTVWFGVLSNHADSRGYRCTKKAVDFFRRPWIENPSPRELRNWIIQNKIEVLNVAGNRFSIGGQKVVTNVKLTICTAMEHDFLDNV
jgi:hypothetical protein